MEQADIEFAKILLDPVAFAEHHFGWKARWYQAKMLRDTSLRRVSRCGRRVGKCFLGESKVITKDGPIKVAELINLKDKPAIITLNQNTHKLEETYNYSIFENGKRQLYKITTKTGRINVVTGNHPFLTIDIDGKPNWIEVDNLKLKDRIAVPSNYKDFIAGIDIGDRRSRLWGYLCGDGGTSQDYVGFTNFDQLIVEDLSDIVKDFNCILSPYKKAGQYYVRSNQIKYNKIIRVCKEIGLLGKLSKNKSVPEEIIRGTKSNISNFLGAYWDCDGWLSIAPQKDKAHPNPSIEIGVCSASEQLARDVQHLLLRLGIVSFLKEKRVKYNGGHNLAWTVTIHDSLNAKKFIELVPLRAKHSKKQEILDILSNKDLTDNIGLYSIPKEIWTYIKNKQEQLGLSNMEVCGAESRKDSVRLRTQYAPSRSKVLEYAKNLKDQYLEDICNEDILWDEVVSIKDFGEEETYDLTVPDTHTFIADDIISHNSDAIAIHMIWYAFTRADVVVLLATPMEAQIKVIFDRIRELVKKSPEIMSSIVKDNSAPNYIEFGNGSKIKGFTAGTRAGAGGGSLRGQSADWIMLDETDYLVDEDIHTINTIAAENDQIGIWASSTPSGKRAKFYEWSLEASGGRAEVDPGVYKGKKWTMFYFPSTCNPNWTKAMEEEWKSELTEEAYQHEIMANFGHETIGVYNKEFIDRARKKYLYLDNPNHQALRTIGIDWDIQGLTNLQKYERIRLVA